MARLELKLVATTTLTLCLAVPVLAEERTREEPDAPTFITGMRLGQSEADFLKNVPPQFALGPLQHGGPGYSIILPKDQQVCGRVAFEAEQVSDIDLTSCYFGLPDDAGFEELAELLAAEYQLAFGPLTEDRFYKGRFASGRPGEIIFLYEDASGLFPGHYGIWILPDNASE